MTPDQREPEQHCGFEDFCRHYCIASQGRGPCKKGSKINCQHDTRRIPAPQQPSEHKCHVCRTLQWDNRLIWSLEELLAWVREHHMDQQDIRNHIDLELGKYRKELGERQAQIPTADAAIKRYNEMDKKSSEEEWNDDFGLIILGVFEKAIKNRELNKTVGQLINEIEREVTR